jgi:ActR/RegA family two-component response regulator
MNVYIPPKPSPLPADFDEFYNSLTQQEKDLHQLAIEKLQSSYFVQWTHMYKDWKKSKDKK